MKDKLKYPHESPYHTNPKKEYQNHYQSTPQYIEYDPYSITKKAGPLPSTGPLPTPIDYVVPPGGGIPHHSHFQPTPTEYGVTAPDPHDMGYPTQSDTIDMSNIHDREYTYQVYSNPPPPMIQNTQVYPPKKEPNTQNTKMDVNDYIYLDQHDVEKIEFDFDAGEDYKILPFEYQPLNYENYDMDEYGNLDFTNQPTTQQPPKPQPQELLSELPKLVEKNDDKKNKKSKNTNNNKKKTKKSNNKNRKKRKRKKKRPLKKRRRLFFKRYGIPYGVGGSVVRPRQRLLRNRLRNRLRRPNGFVAVRRRPAIPKEVIRKSAEGAAYLSNLRSSFDFNSMVAMAGLWVVWNTLLVGIVPSDALLNIANNLFGAGGSGRRNGRKIKYNRQQRNGRKMKNHQQLGSTDPEEIVKFLLEHQNNKNLQ